MSVISVTLFQVGKYSHLEARTVPPLHSKCCKQRLSGKREMLQNQKQCNRIESMPFNSYSHSHGIVTASALLELRPTIQW
jgi:hypothetical protein